MEPEHHDPFSESGRAGLEKLMALGVLTEAGSRLAAERARTRASSEELRFERDQAARTAQDRAQRLARAEQSRRDREWSRLASDPHRLADYLRRLPVQEVARHWVQATTRAGNDRNADAVLAATEGELRVRMPTLMNAYEQARSDGAEPADAMRTAAATVFGGGPRRHGAARALPVLDRDLEQELRRSAGRLDPVERARWLASLQERGWSPQSVAWAEAMLTRAQDERRSAAVDAAIVDDSHMPRNEHVDGLKAAAAANGRAGDLARQAAAAAGAAGHPWQETAGDPAARQLAGQPAGPVRLARLSYATPSQAVLRPAVPPPARSRPHGPEHASRRGRIR
jgi:hypothetical protein